MALSSTKAKKKESRNFEKSLYLACYTQPKWPTQVGSLDFWWSVYSYSTSFFLVVKQWLMWPLLHVASTFHFCSSLSYFGVVSLFVSCFCQASARTAQWVKILCERAFHIFMKKDEIYNLQIIDR